jgi:hypothetical protein
VTIGARVYAWVAALSSPAVANEVLIGGSASASIDNLIAAVNGAAGAGTTYSTGTVAHADVTASAGTGDTMDVVADVAGSAGNAIATTETMAAGSWGAATLTGGEDQESDTTTITQPLNLFGYTGERWLLHKVLTTSNVVVSGPRGMAFEVTGALAYQRLALTAGSATPSDSATVSADITPLA